MLAKPSTQTFPFSFFFKLKLMIEHCLLLLIVVLKLYDIEFDLLWICDTYGVI